MDDASQSAMQLLETLQSANEQIKKLKYKYTLLGYRTSQAGFILSGSPFTVHENGEKTEYHGCVCLGFVVQGKDQKEYDLGLTIFWDATQWLITTELSEINEEQGQVILKELPERKCEKLADCLRQILEAVNDLTQFEEIVTAVETGSE